MVTYRYPIIAREGWPYIAIICCFALLIGYLFSFYFAIPLWLVVFFLCYLFRDPARAVPPVPLAIVGPVDGKISSIETVQDQFIDREAVKIEIEMGLLSIISSRSPMEGKVIEQWFGLQGAKDVAARGSARNMAYAQWIQNDEGDDLVLAYYPNYSFLRPQCYVHSGERIGQGQRYGTIPLGARVAVLMPNNVRVNVNVGDTIRAGADTIARLKSVT